MDVPASTISALNRPKTTPRGLAAATLVLGGARSGKSAHGEALIERAAAAPIYLATATAGDAEMAERIARHRARRGTRWITLEEPLDLAGALAARGAAAPVLIDCLTLWLANLMAARRDPDIETGRLIEALSARVLPAALIANEVGLGIVPEGALARDFRDAAGRMNQRIAAAVGRVVFVAAGLPLTLKDETSGATP